MTPQQAGPATGRTATSSQSGHGFGTAPVFLASISTILGAILFLRFGYAVAHVGLWGSLVIIVIALYLSQAISVAFYLVAFAEAFDPVYKWAAATYAVDADPRWVSLPCTVLLAALILTKGADLGVRALWIVSAILGASIVAFLVLGDIDFIAQILSMFFMVTYGALCAVSFLEYFAGNPSYRPTFHSRWYLSLLGAVMCGLMMIQMNVVYALVAIFLMVVTYFGLRRSRQEERGLTAIFQGTMFQLTRRLQITLQKNRAVKSEGGWRPSIVAVTRFGERRLGHFDLLRWISHRHGFGHFIQFFQGEYSFTEEIEARLHVGRLIERTEVSGAGIFVDSLICPSFQTALAQTLQMPGISGWRTSSWGLASGDAPRSGSLRALTPETQNARRTGFPV